MGTTCYYKGRWNKKYLDHIKFKNQLFEINNEKYSCVDCYRIPEFKEIDFENQNVLIFCPENGKKKISIKDYLVQMDKISKEHVQNVANKNILLMIFKMINNIVKNALRKDLQNVKNIPKMIFRHFVKLVINIFAQNLKNIRIIMKSIKSL